MSTSLSTVLEMLASLPESIQERVLGHLRYYIGDLRDEMRWNETFARSGDKLVAAARKAREEIARGLATPLDSHQL